MFLWTVLGFRAYFIFDFRLLENCLGFLQEFFVLFLALELVEVVVVVLYAENFLFDDFDFIIGVNSILILVECGNKVLVNDRMELNGIDVR